MARADRGDAAAVAVLVSIQADVDAWGRGETPMHMASNLGHSAIIIKLVEAGANVDYADRTGCTALMKASAQGHAATVTTLCEAGASVDGSNHFGHTALAFACIHGNIVCAKVLSSYGAGRAFMIGSKSMTADDIATDHDHPALAAWLLSSREWSTPLHHLTIITAAHARTLLRGGADLHAACQLGGPTPLSLAKELRTMGNAPEGSAAYIVLCASQPWSPQTHAYFPAAAREHAVAVLCAGHLLVRDSSFEGVAGVLLDVWMANVLPRAVTRG